MFKTTAFAVALTAGLTAGSPTTSLSRAETLELLKEMQARESGMGLASDGATRIRLAGRLGMLTQRVAAASCALSSGVAIDLSHDKLETALHEMNIILDALRYGNEDLGVLGPEENGGLLRDLEEMEAEWSPTRGAVEAMLANDQNVENAHLIDDHNVKLLELATVLKSDVMGEYTDPFTMTQADALLVKLATRQKMMTQKMAKNACEIWSDYNVDAGRAELLETMQIFDFTIRALRFGEADYGIVPAPTPEIAETLDKILAGWSGIRDDLDALATGASLDAEGRERLFVTFNAELDDLDRVVFGYKEHAKQY